MIVACLYTSLFWYFYLIKQVKGLFVGKLTSQFYCALFYFFKQVVVCKNLLKMLLMFYLCWMCIGKGIWFCYFSMSKMSNLLLFLLTFTTFCRFPMQLNAATRITLWFDFSRLQTFNMTNYLTIYISFKILIHLLLDYFFSTCKSLSV